MRFRAVLRASIAVALVIALGLQALAGTDPRDPEDRGLPRGDLALPGLSQLLVELETGQAIYSVNPDIEMPPASLAKLMSLYIAWSHIEDGRLSLGEKVTVSINAWTQRVGGSAMFLEPGDVLDLDTLLRGIAVASGNDASVALSEHIARTEDAFVALMNSEARRLGMDSTRFVSASGLARGGEDGTTTARDMALLAREYVLSFPEALEYHSQRYLNWKIHRLRSYNGLLWDPRVPVNGLKTGFTTVAGHHLIATAVEDDLFLVAVVMGAASTGDREDTAAMLLEYGFSGFRVVREDWGRRIPASTRVWQGAGEEVLLTIREEGLAVVAPRGIPVDSRVEIDSPVRAPVSAGQKLGELVLLVPRRATGEDEEIVRLNIVAAEPVARGGIFRVILDAIMLFFNQRLGRPV